jgi:hypothetical protein
MHRPQEVVKGSKDFKDLLMAVEEEHKVPRDKLEMMGSKAIKGQQVQMGYKDSKETPV